MSYNGSGTFTINTTGQPVVAGTIISASAFNSLTSDLATGLTTAITKDGQTTTTARITFAQGLTSSLVTDSSSISTGSIITAGGLGVAKALYVGTTANVASTTDSSSISTGSIVTAGGVGIAKNVYVGGTLNVTGATTLTNPVINNIKMGYSTTATAAGTTTLTISSNYRQFFTGTLAQTIVLPVTSTLVTGIAYEIENNSTGTLTVNSSGGNLVGTVPAGVCAHAVCIGTTLTTAADWDWDYIATTTITGTGANVLGTSPSLTTPTIGGGGANFNGSTSGTINLVASATAGSNTATLPAATGTVMVSGNMPAFSAYSNAAQTISNLTYTKISLQVEEFDTASAFDSTTNYRFTPLVAGYYQISGGMQFNATICRSGIALIYRNGTSYKQGTFMPQATTTDATSQAPMVSSLVYLNGSTDYVELYGWSQTLSGTITTTSGSIYTWFNGSLVRSA